MYCLTLVLPYSLSQIFTKTSVQSAIFNAFKNINVMHTLILITTLNQNKFGLGPCTMLCFGTWDDGAKKTKNPKLFNWDILA